MNEQQVKKQKQLEAVRKWINNELTGKIEQWPGRRNPMVTAYLKNKGQRPGPKGTSFAKETAAKFIDAQLESLKSSGFYLRATFMIPNVLGKEVEHFGTLISVTKAGELIYSCRERHQVDIETAVDFVENSADADVAEAIKGEDDAGEIEVEDDNILEA